MRDAQDAAEAQQVSAMSASFLEAWRSRRGDALPRSRSSQWAGVRAPLTWFTRSE